MRSSEVSGSYASVQYVYYMLIPRGHFQEPLFSKSGEEPQNLHL